MKRFIRFIGLVTVVILVLAIGLDKFYTFNCHQPVHPRNKVSWLFSLDKHKEFDYALFGSSRVFHHLNTLQINRSTGLNGINLGYEAANPLEIKLMLEAFLEHYTAKKIFIQVDNSFNRIQEDRLAITPWLPYTEKKYVYKQLKRSDSLAFYYKYVPFYKYMHNEAELGFRNVFLSYLKPKEDLNSFGGFVPLYGSTNQFKKVSYILEDHANPYLEEIKEIASNHAIEVYFFTAPYFDFSGNNEIMKKYLRDHTDFSKLAIPRKCF